MKAVVVFALCLLALAVIVDAKKEKRDEPQVKSYKFQLTPDNPLASRDEQWSDLLTFFQTESELDLRKHGINKTEEIRLRTSLPFTQYCGGEVPAVYQVEEYVSGPFNGEVTVEVFNIYELSEKRALKLDYVAADPYKNDSAWFLEQDVSTCHTWWVSHNTIGFDEVPTVKTCGDLLAIFPLLASNNSVNFTVPVPPPTPYWFKTYTADWVDYDNCVIRFELNIDYESVYDAEDDYKPRTRDFSITLIDPSDDCLVNVADVFNDMSDYYIDDRCDMDDLIDSASSLQWSILVLAVSLLFTLM